MKVKQEDYETLLSLLKGVIEKYGMEKINLFKENLRNHGTYKDFEKRWQWDFLHASEFTERAKLLAKLYSYGCNDTHIDTALKRAMKELSV